jgi:gliding motility-associated-like protein
MRNIPFVLFITILFFSKNTLSQCRIVSTSSPYSEGFETSNGGWIAGGTNVDWVYGSPSKNRIISAGGGLKCMFVGGFATTPYKSAQRSYLQSTCFDFSQMKYPRISFKIFWECENTYDGMSFQSSIDSGKTWNVVGIFSEKTNCETDNWFNTSSINNLSGMGSSLYGWSGTISQSSGGCQGGGGSNGWVTAKHCLKGLGGKSNVYLRFVFGSGTSCNDFDGVAIDDILIDESQPIVVDFNAVCTGYNTYTFTNNSSTCASSFLWKFNDPASGMNNLSTQKNPIHTFTLKAPFIVKLISTNPCGIKDSIEKSISGMFIANSSKPVSCSGKKDGSITITVSNFIGTPNFYWYNLPSINKPQIKNLDTGIYFLKVFDQNLCEVRDTFLISQKPPLQVSSIIRPETCNEGNGNIVIKVFGGTVPYVYLWSNLSNMDSNSNLIPGAYSLTIVDFMGCNDTSNYTIVAKPFIPIDIVINHIVTCFGYNDGELKSIATAGSPPFLYHWSNNSFIQENSNLSSNNYTVTITDKNNCTGSASFILTEPLSLNVSLSSLPDKCRENTGSATGLVTGGTKPYIYLWSNNESSPSINKLKTDLYSLTVTDRNGCNLIKYIKVDSTPKVIHRFNIIADTCFKNTGEISLNVLDGIKPYTFYFQNNFTNDSIFPALSKGDYKLVISDFEGCHDTVNFSIPLLQKSYDKTVDTSFCFHQNKYFITPGAFSKYTWNTGSSSSSINISKEDKYSVECMDDWGCQTTNIFNVRDTCPEDIIFPTAFTPNGDGLNDIFRPIYKSNISSYTLEVFNRWGELIFQSINPSEGWNGNNQNGVYVWFVKYQYESGGMRYTSGNFELLK